MLKKYKVIIGFFSLNKKMKNYLSKFFRSIFNDQLKIVYLRRIIDNFVYIFEQEISIHDDYKAQVVEFSNSFGINKSHGFSSRNIIELEASIIDPLTGQAFIKDTKNHIYLVAESSQWNPELSIARLRNRDSHYKRRKLNVRDFEKRISNNNIQSPFAGANGYYHWLIEDLPSFLRIKEKYEDVHYVIGGNLYKRSQEILEITNSNYSISSNYTSLNKTVFAEKGHEKALAHPKDLLLLTNFLKSNFSNPVSEHNEHVFMQRKDNRSKTIRSIELETQLSNSSTINCCILEAEGFSLYELAGKLAHTRVIIGFHGANLANLIFAPKLEKCIELIPQNFDRGIDVIEWLCNLKSIKYKKILFTTEMDGTSILSKIEKALLDD